MSTLPNSPMVLDVTGQAMVTKLEAIRQAILAGGGGGGGSMPMPPEYDADQEESYHQGEYTTYNGLIYKANQDISGYSGHPVGAFDDTKWDEVTDHFFEFFQSKPGAITSLEKHSEVFNDTYTNVASGFYSHVEGQSNTASGSYAHVEGYNNTASANYSHVEGNGNQATQNCAHAEGSSTQATGYDGAHAEGYYTKATGSRSHAEGYSTTAGGNASHAEGDYSKATGTDSHAEGYKTEASGYASHTEGYQTKATNGDGSHAEGYYCEATGAASHAEGSNCKAKGNRSHAQNYECQANGVGSTAAGYYSKANAEYSVAVGYQIQTDAMYEHSVGTYNESINDGSAIPDYYESGVSYAVGDIVRVVGDTTQSIYRCTTAITAPAGTFDNSKWTVIGHYDYSNPILFSVGNGNYSARHNAFEVRKDGTIKFYDTEMPKPPTTDGTYTLQCTVSNGVATYAWV